MGLSGKINRTLRTLRSGGPARHARLVLASIWTGAARDVPSISCPALDWLEGLDLSSGFVVEFGSGASTAYFARRAARLLSIEHDAGWHAEVSRRLESWRAGGGAMGAVEARLIEPEGVAAAGGGGAGDGGLYASAESRYAGVSFRGYASAVDGLADGSVELAFIDGRARRACAVHVEPKIRAGGAAMLDNAERAHYRPIFELFAGRGYAIAEHRGLGVRSGKIWTTAVFVKPG